ncbi:hypothetical protein [Flavobacterium ginsenosidimutans]|uniref:hypothetical protein n=1 Tax=Flavobacterium ginsenosidimutans TaxID=687844 RepID=UPI000DAC9D77|nr:hypothetical protein [Flavobacterium ginsenosidimutans]KAF2326708.1 hypothetical protein DM444_22790 [Flavobacterium ginsenosidimutans]
MKKLILMAAASFSITAICQNQKKGSEKYLTDASQKEASKFTKELNEAVYKQLAFDDKTAFKDVDRGFIAPLINNGDIKDVISATKMNFMQNKEAPATVNPSLWRHAQLVNRGGLYKVIDNIYQVRGQDLVNLSIIETNNGIILFDIEYSPETLAKSIELYEKNRGKRPLKAVSFLTAMQTILEELTVYLKQDLPLLKTFPVAAFH